MATLADTAGVTLSYNSLQSSTATGSYCGLTAAYYPDPGYHQFPAPGTTSAGYLYQLNTARQLTSMTSVAGARPHSSGREPIRTRRRRR
jgi:hypothetical protein